MYCTATISGTLSNCTVTQVRVDSREPTFCTMFFMWYWSCTMCATSTTVSVSSFLEDVVDVWESVLRKTAGVLNARRETQSNKSHFRTYDNKPKICWWRRNGVDADTHEAAAATSSSMLKILRLLSSSLSRLWIKQKQNTFRE